MRAMASEAKSKELRVYVTPREALLVQRAAKTRGQAFTSWARECLLVRALETIGADKATGEVAA